MASVTESPSRYDRLEHMPMGELLAGINAEDRTVPQAVEKALPQIEALASAILERMQAGGRLFYIGAGTSGRLGVVDASELPPTFGVDHGRVVGLIAGGDGAIRKAVEFAEDDTKGAWRDLEAHSPTEKDCLVGIAASGRTPYVVGGAKAAKKAGMLTGCIVCNPESALAEAVEHPVEVIVGPEFVTGSTRMKAGTAQKLVLNMISTAVMIGMGRVKGNRMVDMQLSNTKLVDRGTRMVMEATGLTEQEAAGLLQAEGSVRNAVDAYRRDSQQD